MQAEFWKKVFETTAAAISFLLFSALCLLILSMLDRRLCLLPLAARFLLMSASVWPVVGIPFGGILYLKGRDSAGLTVSLSASIIVALVYGLTFPNYSHFSLGVVVLFALFLVLVLRGGP